jgi:arylsulfatase A-like enzyme
LRADRLGVYGHPKPTTPRLDAFARDAVRFSHAYAHSSETRFSLASLLTGFHPHETRVPHGRTLPGEVETLAEILRAHGRATAAVVSNYVLRGDRGWRQGFDVYDDQMPQHEIPRNWPERIATDTTQRAVELLEDLHRSPFFLWVHYQDPHGPYTPPPPYADEFRDRARPPQLLRVNPGLSGLGGIPSYQRLGDERDLNFYVSQYDGEVRYVDEEIGRLLAALRRLGAYDRTLIVFTADHGESLGEHDHYLAHMEYLYSELTRVPLLIRFGDERGGTRDDFVQHVDLLPTILAALELPVPAGLRGSDLRAPRSGDPAIFSEIDLPSEPGGRRTSLVWRGFRLIHSRPGDRFELYDLASDPGELRDLAPDPAQAARLAEMSARLLELEVEDRLGIRSAEPPPPLSEDERRKLEALGYVR